MRIIPNIFKNNYQFKALIFILFLSMACCKPDNYKTDNLPSNGLATVINLDTNYKNFNKAVLISGLSSEINSGQYTVLVPSDMAFKIFLDNNGKKLTDLSSDTLKVIIGYHMLLGDVNDSFDGKPTFIGSNLNLNGATSVPYTKTARKGKAFIIDKVLIPPTIHSLH